MRGIYMDSNPMCFVDAFQCLQEGLAIKRAGWLGYWVREGDDVVMYCKDGSVVKMSEGCSGIFTLSHCTENDWMVVKKEHREELDLIRASGILKKTEGCK